MNKVLIEIEYEFLGDFLQQQDKIAEGFLILLTQIQGQQRLGKLCGFVPHSADMLNLR